MFSESLKKSKQKFRCKYWGFGIRKFGCLMTWARYKYQKVTKSEQWPKCHKFWSHIKQLHFLNNDQNVENSDLWKNVTKSEHWPKCHKFRSKVKNYKNGTVTKMSHILIKGQKVTKSEQWPKRRIFWSKFKKLQNVINDQNVQNSDQLSESYEIWTIILIKGQKVTKSEQGLECHNSDRISCSRHRTTKIPNSESPIVATKFWISQKLGHK